MGVVRANNNPLIEMQQIILGPVNDRLSFELLVELKKAIRFMWNSVHALRHVRSHVRVSTHMQNPPYEPKIARANITINY